MGMRCGFVCGGIGLVTFVIGIITVPIFHVVLKDMLKKLLPLKPGSYSYPKWKDVPIPMEIQIFVFDCVNADEVMRTGARPFLVEKGPYTYRVEKKKVNITFNPNSTLTYRQLTWYYFDRSKSVGPDTDNFTCLNVPFAAASTIIRYEFPWVEDAINLVFGALDQHMYTTLQVRDIVWGYEDPTMKLVFKDILGLFNLSTLLDDHFGFFYKWNGSDDGLFTIFTGKEDLNRIAFVNRFNRLSSLPYWSDGYANMLNGSDGTFFPPLLDKSKRQYVFSPEACRTLYIEYQRDSEFKGIKTLRYIMPDSMLGSVDRVPDNVGFCTPDTNHCIPSGVLNVSTCKSGAPALLSLPHFLGADPEVLATVGGLHPDEDMHRAVMDVEPTTGLPMNVKMRLQLNLLVTNNSRISGLKERSTIYHPILWFNETAGLDDALAAEFREKLEIPIEIIAIVHIALIALGAVIVSVTVLYFFYKYRKSKRITPGKSDDAHSLITN